MRILVISCDYPEPMAGAAAKETYCLINAWIAQGHVVTCVAASEPGNTSILGHCGANIEVVMTSTKGRGRRPLRPWHFGADFRSLAATLAVSADLVFGQEIWTA